MKHKFSIRRIALTLAVTGLVSSFAANVLAEDKLKVGLMLPATGTFASLGNAITNGFKLYVAENGGKIAGREIEYFMVDDESDPAKATENANKLVKRDKVDVLVGTVHSGVAMAMAKVVKESGTLMIVPNAGADELTGVACAPNIFRTSFSNWQPGFAMGQYVAKKHKSVVTLTWKYAAGQQMVDGFKESFEKGGGKVLKEMTLPFPNVEFQAFLTEIAALKPEAVYVFFAGGGAAKFVKDYVAAGLSKSIPLYAPGFLTDGTLEAMGGSGEGIYTALHYADGLKNPKNIVFEKDFAKAYKGANPDVYAVQGYDAAQLLAAGLKTTKGSIEDKAALIKAMETAKIDSPRGTFTMSAAHNPVQDFYLRKAVGKENLYVEVIQKALSDPARGCKM